MSDVTTGGSVPVGPEAKAALTQLEAQIAALESMLPGAKAAGIDVRTAEATLAALRDSMAALKRIPGV